MEPARWARRCGKASANRSFDDATPGYDPFLLGYFSERFFAVPGAADDGQVCSALVRRRASGLDELHVVFPDSAAGWICLRALAWIAPQHPAPGVDPPCIAGGLDFISADLSAVRTVE